MGHNTLYQFAQSPWNLADPGNAGALPRDKDGIVNLVSTGAETRTLADPVRAGIQLTLNFLTDGGDITVTVASAFDDNATTTIAFANAGEMVMLVSRKYGTGYRWHLAGVLNGLTATTAELNTLDGILATTAELNRASDVSTRSVAAGGTLTLTELAHDGKTILLDTAAGSVVTLPTPAPVGMKVRCIVTVKPTSNFHQVKVGAATDFMGGSVDILDNDAAAQGAFAADSTSDDNIQLNGTTKGGQIGDWIELEAITTTVWAIRGTLVCPTGSNPADMFSAAV